MDRNRRIDWSTLPSELLEKIGKSLYTQIDTLRIRAVCHAFRSSIPSPPKPSFPLKIPLPDTLKAIFRHNCVLLRESTVYTIKPIGGISEEKLNLWMVRVEELNSGKVRIMDLVFGVIPIMGLPFRDINMPFRRRDLFGLQEFNLLDYRVHEVTKAYKFELVAADHVTTFDVHEEDYVAVSSHFDDSLLVKAIFFGDELHLWSHKDQKWTKIEINVEIIFVDVVYHNNRFYVLDSSGRTISVDAKSLNVSEVASSFASLDWASISKYLVKSSNDLYLVDQYSSPVLLKVYKLDEEKREWVLVVGQLENRVWFLGQYCSFSLSMKEFPAFKRNCAYITYEMFNERYDDYELVLGIFDMECETVGLLSAFPDYSKIFSPPTWLKWKQCSL